MPDLGPFELDTIVVGDCLDVMRQMPDGCVDAVITDPPFKLSQTYTANVDADNLMAVSSIWPAGHELFRLCKPGIYVAMYYDTRILPLALEAMRWAGFKYLRGLTFYRRWGAAHKLYGWMSTSDFILLFRKPADVPYRFYSTDWRHDVYTREGPQEFSANHAVQKPQEDVLHMVGHLSPENAIIFDPFMGSGTTAVAAKKLGRHYFGCDINPEYVEMARKRVAKVDGVQLELAV